MVTSLAILAQSGVRGDDTLPDTFSGEGARHLGGLGDGGGGVARVGHGNNLSLSLST